MRQGFYVAFEGSYEDPEHKGALAGPYPTLKYAREWVDVLRIALAVSGPEKRPLYIIRVAEYGVGEIRESHAVPKVTKNDVYNHLGEAMQDHLPEDGSAELGMDHNKLFLRMGSQVFAISIEEKEQFAKADDPDARARQFMSTLPFWPWRRE